MTFPWASPDVIAEMNIPQTVRLLRIVGCRKADELREIEEAQARAGMRGGKANGMHGVKRHEATITGGTPPNYKGRRVVKMSPSELNQWMSDQAASGQDVKFLKDDEL